MDFNIVQSFIIKLPSVEELKRLDKVRELSGKYSETIVEEYLKKIIDKRHKAIVSAQSENELSMLDFSFDYYINVLRSELAVEKGRPLKKIINCTGTIYSEYMGNRIYSPEILKTFNEVFGSYSNISMDEEKGTFVEIESEVRKILSQMLKGKDYLMVNGMGSALFLLIDTFFKDSAIGMGIADTFCFEDGMGVQDIIEKAGAKVRYLGYINKVTLSDYSSLLENNGVIFTDMLQNSVNGVKRISFDEFSKVGNRNIYMTDKAYIYTEAPEIKSVGIAIDKIVKSDIWASVVDVSKFVGGPDIGIIIADEEVIEFIKNNFISKILSPSKEAKMLFYFVLKAYSERKYNEIFVNKCFGLTTEKLREKNRRMMRNLEREIGNKAEIGSMGDKLFKLEDRSEGNQTFEREIIYIRPNEKSASEIERKLRMNEPLIICWLDNDKLLFNMQLVADEEENVIIDALTKYI